MGEFAKQIYELRRAAGLSQAEVGEIAGVSSVAVGKWERGIAEPDISKLTLLAEHFGVTLDDLCGRELGFTAADGAPDEPTYAMAKAFRRLTGEEREMLVNLGRTLFAGAFDDDEPGDLPWRE